MFAKYNIQISILRKINTHKNMHIITLNFCKIQSTQNCLSKNQGFCLVRQNYSPWLQKETIRKNPVRPQSNVGKFLALHLQNQSA